MLLRPTFLTLVLSGFLTASFAQTVQVNTQVNTQVNVVRLPGYAARPDLDLLRERMNQSSLAAQAASDREIQLNNYRVLNSMTDDLVGEPMATAVRCELTSACTAHLAVHFKAADDISWELPVGTVFWLLTGPGPAYHTKLYLSSFALHVPATYNGFQHEEREERCVYVNTYNMRWKKLLN